MSTPKPTAIHDEEEEPIEAEVETVDDNADLSAVGRIKAIFGMLTRFAGVKDMSSLRISLPSGMLMPMSNLEWWNYNDRPDFFIEIPQPDDPLDRMLKVVRWWYSKDTKWMHSKLAKPYNSVLGEEFVCTWDVNETNIRQAEYHEDKVQHLLSPVGPPATSSLQQHSNAPPAPIILHEGTRVYSVTEQISHHPPVSAYYYYCPEKKLTARGVDHISGRFTGTNVKVFPGNLNKGIYVTLGSRDNEEYNLTHPCASVSGFLKASLYITVSEQTIITCPKTRMKAILEYKDEPYFGRAKFAIQGKIVRYDPASTTPAGSSNASKLDDADVLCTLSGCWRGKIDYKKTGNSGTADVAGEQMLLVDMETLLPFPKTVPESFADKVEASRKIWQPVTENILCQNFAEATKQKRIVEDAQRKERQERAQRGEKFLSHWFWFMDDSGLGNVAKERESTAADTGAGLEGKPFLRKDRHAELPWVLDGKN